MSIYVRNITKTFHNYPVVDDVSFELEPGRCVTLIGPNGAGKTTLLKMLTGLLKADSGEISFHKERDWERKIGFLPQTPHFYGWMTAYEFLNFLGNVSGLGKAKLSARIPEVLHATGLNDVDTQRIEEFSGGMKQRLGLAQAILHQPTLLLLDEPVSALDPVGRRDFMEILLQLKKTTTILYSTHILHDAEEISDDVLLMKEGKVIAQGTLDHLLSQTTQTYVLKSALPLPKGRESFHFVNSFKMIDDKTVELVLPSRMDKKQLLQWCLDKEIDVISFQERKQTLENLFMKAVKK